MNAEPRGAMLITAAIALVLTVLPLPPYLALVRPMFLVLTVLYWSIASPRTGGIALGFFAGLMIDVFPPSTVLGEHALALTFITYVAVREHQKIRSKPAFQQSLIVFAVLVAYETILFGIDGWTHHAVTNPWRWAHTLSGAILWAPVAAVLNATNDRRR
jgi:rod shape-determining protein MreD